MKHPKTFDTTPETSKRMSKIKLKRGNAEVMLAKALWNSGIKGYRYNYKKIPGSPDIAILRPKIAIFVDGEFWHGHDWIHKKYTLKRNREYWIQKIEENMQRDIRNDKLLLNMGWIPIHFWTQDVNKNLSECLKTVREILFDVMIEDNIEDDLGTIDK